MRPAPVLVAAEEAGVVAVQVPVGAVRRAGRQVAVAGREGRSHREAVAEVRVHAHSASPGGELVAAFIPTGVELGVGARAFHPHVEAGEVVVDVGRVDAHEGGPVPDPAHLVAQGVLLCRPKRVDRAPCRRRQGTPGGGRIIEHIVIEGTQEIRDSLVYGTIPGSIPKQIGARHGIGRVRYAGIDIVRLFFRFQHHLISFLHQMGILVIGEEKASDRQRIFSQVNRSVAGEFHQREFHRITRFPGDIDIRD